MNGTNRYWPPLDDGSGYKVTIEDLEYLGVSIDDVDALRDRFRPLGFNTELYAQFRSSLHRAMVDENVEDADVRLQGSSAHFFSGWHKGMIYDREGLVDEFRARWRRVPAPNEVSNAFRTVQSRWPADQIRRRPKRRMFDIMNRLGVDPKRSDFDVQISSDKLVRRAVDRIAELGIDDPSPYITSSEYRFVRKDLVEATCPYLMQWRTIQTRLTKRPVSIAVFDSAGPPDTETPVSSHFKPTDWSLKGES